VIPFSVTALPGHHQYAHGLVVEKVAGSEDPAVFKQIDMTKMRMKVIFFMPLIDFY